MVFVGHAKRWLVSYGDLLHAEHISGISKDLLMFLDGGFASSRRLQGWFHFNSSVCMAAICYSVPISTVSTNEQPLGEKRMCVSYRVSDVSF